MLRRIMLGENVTQRNSGNSDKVALGALKNMGCIGLDQSARWQITDQTKAALAIQD